MSLHSLRRSSSIIVVSGILLSPLAFSQSKEEVKQQAESQLRQMTPEEIDRKLKELGISRDEAFRRAQDLGISLEDYLQKPAGQTEETAPAQFDPRLGFQQRVSTPKLAKADTLRTRQLLEKYIRRVEIPGFKGRRGIDSLLQPLGYDLFQLPAETFEPSVNVSTPPSYALGAGDELLITVWGETRLNYRLTVNREGNVVLPDVGPLAVRGLTLQQFRDRLVRRMTSVYSGLRGGAANANTFLDVSLGKLKTIQVFVLGEVVRPGGYALSSMSTSLNALFAAGGPTPSGTLREVSVLRTNDTIPPVDIYQYIVSGEKSKDVFLQDGDVVFVKPTIKRVAIVGQVVRPAIYELKEGESLGDALTLAGGLRFDAYIDRVHIERIVPFEQRKMYQKDIIDFDVRSSGLSDLLHSRERMETGDIVTVLKIASLFQNRVYISGNVGKPGPFALTPDMHVHDLILAADSLLRNTFSERATLFRVLPNLRRELYGFNPRLALMNDEKENLALQNEDSVVVYPDSLFFPVHTVSISGAVRHPGTYVRDENMSVADLVVLAGGLTENATTSGWEISRRDTSELNVYRKIIKVDMGSEYWEDGTRNEILLKDFDAVLVPYNPRFVEQKVVKLTGYVMYPGIYTIRFEGERLADMFKRAGGLRKGAYLEGSKLIRKFNNAGLVPLDFKSVVEDENSRDNVVLYDGDSIHVAFTEDVVYVSGEVYVPSPVLYKEGAGLSYYIEQAGDYKQEAEESKTVVFLPGGKKWDGGEILPGSTIFVPRKIEKEDKTLQIVSNLVTILASLAAITVALIQVRKL